MNLWQKIKYFFTWTIPDNWEKLKHWWQDTSLVYRLMAFVLIFMVTPLTIYKSHLAYQNAKANHARQIKIAKQRSQKTGQLANKVKETPEDKKIIKDGPKKYLRDVMMMNQHQVVEAFNNNANYHGRYNAVIEHAAKLGDINSFRDYLNPIIDEVENGETIQAQRIHHKFELTTDPNDITADDMNNGAMIISWNSHANNAQQTANQIDNIIKNAKGYQCFVFDTYNQAGKNNYLMQFTHFMSIGDKMRDGFDSSNAWAGTIYAFNNGLLVYHSKNLNNVPNKLPVKSIANSDIQNKVPDFYHPNPHS